MKRIDDFLNSIYRNVEGEQDEIQDFKEEMRVHLLEKVNEHKQNGKTEDEAINLAIEEFGDEKQIKKGLAEFFYMPKIRFFQKLLTAFLSALIFSGILSAIIYTPETQQMPNVQYWSFSSLFMLYGVYSLVVFIIGGIPYSILMDKIVNKTNIKNKYVADVLIYILGGIIVNVWFWISLFNPYGIVWDHSINLLLMGIGASLLFLHLFYISKKVFKD